VITAVFFLLAPGADATTPSAVTDDFTAALAEFDTAQLEFQNGQPERFKALWSTADDVTLAGGFGGQVEKGWAAVSKRLDWAASQFTEGSHENIRLVASSSRDLGYVVQHERITFTPAGAVEPTTRDYRATMVFRRESAGWRIVHRHADTQLAKAKPH
jgi:ketosteroid isomerase-like protein